MPAARFAQLLDNCKTYITDKKHLALIEDAYLYAKSMHTDQKRKSGEEYIVHPLDVAIIISEDQTDP